MRVTCHSCKTDYIVSDARVAGKRRTAHCGKCDANFVIDGRDLLTAPEDDVWLVRHYEQSELDTEALTTALSNGRLPLRGTVVWRRGMDDWAPVVNVQHLVAHATPVALTAEAGTRSPRAPAVATLDMALSNTSTDAPSTPASGVGVAPRPQVSDQALRLLTPVPEGAVVEEKAPDASPLSDAILNASEAPPPAARATRTTGGHRRAHAESDLAPRTISSPTLPRDAAPSGALAAARLRDEPLIFEGGDAHEPLPAASGVSGTRRIQIESSRPPRADDALGRSSFPPRRRRTSGPPRAGSGHVAPDSVRPISSARAAAEAADVERGARAATRLSILAAAGFLGCLALLHRFSGEPDGKTPTAKPEVTPRSIVPARVPQPVPAPAGPAPTALLPPPPPPATTQREQSTQAAQSIQPKAAVAAGTPRALPSSVPKAPVASHPASGVPARKPTQAPADAPASPPSSPPTRSPVAAPASRL